MGIFKAPDFPILERISEPYMNMLLKEKNCFLYEKIWYHESIFSIPKKDFHNI